MSKQLVRQALQELAERDSAPHTDLWPGLHQKLRPHVGRKPYRRLALATSLALLLVLVATFTLVEPARTWAEDTASGLLGYFGFNHNPPVQPRPGQAINHTEPDSQNCVQVTSRARWCLSEGMAWLDQAEAQKQVGFPVKMPTYLPANYEAAKGFIVRADARIASSDWYPTGASLGRCGEDGPITLVRSPAGKPAENEIPIGNAKTTSVKIGTETGLWVEKAGVAWCSDSSGKRTPQDQSFLVWEHSGVRYWMTGGSNFNLTEALKIAESIS